MSKITELPTDLVAILLLTPVAMGSLLTLSFEPVRFVIGMLFLLVPLGYAVVYALFPENSETLSLRHDTVDSSGIILRYDLDTIDRIALSCGVSIVGIALLGLGIEFSPLRFEPLTAVFTLGLATMAATAVAMWRRRQLPEHDRYTASGGYLGRIYREFTNPASSAELALNVVVVVALLSAAAGSAFVLMADDSQQGGTEFYLLSESDGTPQAADYPENVTVGSETTLNVTVENNAAVQKEYTVVAQVEHVSANGTVTRAAELERFTRRVDGNTPWSIQHTFSPEAPGDNVRLQYLLYEGPVPEEPRARNADRDLHLWLTVTAASADDTSTGTDDDVTL